jgi:hypothetical protein
VNPSAAPTSVEAPHEAVDELITRVLSGAHRTMECRDAPDEARAVLHLAHSFADELATLDPRFDRLQFIKEVMDDPS